MNVRPARRRSLLADLLRCLLSLISLAALLIGLPAVLYVAGRALFPLGLDSVGSVSDLFTQQDTGAVALLVLTAVGWIGWASFTLSVLLEIPAQLRGRTAPRLRGLRWNQRMAAGLVGGVLVLLPTAGGALAAQPAPPSTAVSRPSVTASATPGQDGTADKSADTAKRSGASHPTYTVRDTRPADSLWSIAEQRLGDGERWTEIADLNEGRTMPGGRTFHAADPIQPGWILFLPGKAAPQSDESVTVHPGDTLWEIAGSELGDPTRYPEIFAANEGHAMDGAGRHLTDPDLIQPGWKVEIPAQAGDTNGPSKPDPETPRSPAPEDTAPPSPSPSPSQRADGSKPDDASSQEATPSPSASKTAEGSGPGAGASQEANPPASPSQTAKPSTEPSDETSPSSSGPRPAESAQGQPSATPGGSTGATTPPSAPADASSTPRQDSAEPVSEESQFLDVATIATWGGLLATGLLSVLAIKRMLQRRGRRTGEAIALPPNPAVPHHPMPETAVPEISGTGNPPDLADLERRMRATENPEGAVLIDRALRTLAHHLASAGRPLPELVAVRLTPAALELWLDSPAEPVGPFTAPARPTRWVLPAGTDGLLSADECREVCAPYPALATLGRDPQGALVLADLEALGVLLLPSETTAVLPVVRALAAELATTPWSDDLGVLLSGLDSGISAIEEGFGRLTMITDPQAAISEVGDWARTVRTALADAGADSVRAARTRPYGADAWTPRIALCADTIPAATTDAVRDILDAPACAALVVAADDTAVPGAVRLPGLAGGTVTLAGTDIHIVPQHINDADYTALLGLFDITAEPPQAQPPVLEPLSAQEEQQLASRPTTWIRLLGTPQITGTAQELAPAAAGRLTEIAAWIALHPGSSNEALTEALWPGGVSAAYRTAQLSALRRWLGAEISSGDSYALTGDIGTDWHRFHLLLRSGDLSAALDLVEGRPLDGTPPRRYIWADPTRQEMTTAVVDTAVRLAELHLAEGDAAAARAAADRGLRADPAAEQLHRLAIQAANAMGDREAVETYAAQVDAVTQSLGTDMQPETSALLADLARRPAPP
ncbi:BTAD domain-containing putative transcriptional regulator [Streptomyces sp. NPDC018833]|uniref:BTAD domain-containing putative transcriptional regulator n=1 Tax=Streptomyces sp. NPDC018833 TaxID=3365053 RepID=UPI003790015F